MCHANLTFTDGCCLTNTTELVLPTSVYQWRPRFVLPMHKAKYRCWISVCAQTLTNRLSGAQGKEAERYKLHNG